MTFSVSRAWLLCSVVGLSSAVGCGVQKTDLGESDSQSADTSVGQGARSAGESLRALQDLARNLLDDRLKSAVPEASRTAMENVERSAARAHALVTGARFDVSAAIRALDALHLALKKCREAVGESDKVVREALERMETAIEAAYQAIGHQHVLAERFSGRFDNLKQSQEDPKNFPAVTYVMCRVRATGSQWPAGTVVNFVEQTIILGPRKVVRRAFYVGFPAVENKVPYDFYAPLDENALAGFCEKPTSQRVVAFAELKHTPCPMNFQRDKGVYLGETRKGQCPSTFMGAAQLEISERILPEVLEVWERWYDKDGKQVAGSRVGPFLYVRQER